MTNKQILLITVLVVLIIGCGFALVGLMVWQLSAGESFLAAEPIPTPTFTPTRLATQVLSPTPLPTPLPPTPAPPEPEKTQPHATGQGGGLASPVETDASLGELELSTEQKLLQAELPERDQRLLAMRLKNKGQEIPEIVQETPVLRQLGDRELFWVTDNQQEPPRQFQVEAELKYMTDHSYWWVQDGFSLNEEGLRRSAEQFETQTYPTNRAFFGSEWSPGVDGDPRVHILMGDVPGVAGYYSASNEYSKLAEPYSNEREMFFINLNAISPGNSYFDGVLAHEFQHMIHWHQDRNEATWVNEGMSELATFLNGYGPSNFVGAFIVTPDTQLNGWADSSGAATPNYGGSFLFMAYFLQRYGEELTQAVVSHHENSISGFNAALAENGISEQFDEIFADFVVANYLQDSAAGQGRWGYQDFSPGSATLAKLYRSYPQAEMAVVNQYGTDYVELTGFGDVTINFAGATGVNILDNQAHSGSYQWYSHRGDDTNTRLTRAFDLSQVGTATLNYWTWYDIEEHWDYGYVEVSTDAGRTWTILQTPHSASDNPSGNAYGPGYTGQSGLNGPIWIEESLDLSPYAGQEVLVRFEYVTDDAINRSGWAIDDISIPEIDFFDDAERGEAGWQAEGFVRIDNVLEQKFLVQVVEIGDEVEVHRLALDANNTGSFTITALGDRLERAVLTVSGLTPVTSQVAGYEYRLTSTD